MFIQQNQARSVIDKLSAQTGDAPDVVIQNLIQNGHILEGLNDKQPTPEQPATTTERIKEAVKTSHEKALERQGGTLPDNTNEPVRETIGKISELSKGITEKPFSTALQAGGEIAGLGTKAIGGVVEALTPDIVKEKVSQGLGLAANTAYGQRLSRQFGELKDAYDAFKQQHPEEAKNLEATGKIAEFASMFLGGEIGTKVVEKVGGKLSPIVDKAAGTLEKSAAEQIYAKNLEHAKKLIEPSLTKTKKEKQFLQASAQGRLKEPSMFKEAIVEPKKHELGAIEEISKLDIDSKKAVKSLNTITNEQNNVVRVLRETLKEKPMEISIADQSALKSAIDNTLAEGFTSQEALNFGEKLKKFLTLNIERNPIKNANDFWNLRKALDNWAIGKSSYFKLAEPKREALDAGRNVLNDWLDLSVPDAEVKAKFKQWSNLQTAAERVTPKAVAGSSREITNIYNRVSKLADFKHAALTALAAGGIYAAGAPVIGTAAAVGIPAYLIFKGGKFVVSPQVKQGIAAMLRAIERKLPKATPMVREELTKAKNELMIIDKGFGESRPVGLTGGKGSPLEQGLTQPAPLTKGSEVEVNLGHKTVKGIVVKDDGGKYITVKHDNFAGEIFGRNQVKPLGKTEGAIPIKLLQEAKKYKSAEEFVKAQGETIYHGTAGKFDMFDDSMKGSVTGAKSAHGATWFTNDPAVAKAYSIYAAESGPINKLLKQHEVLEKIAQKSGKNSDWAKVDALTQKIDDLGGYDATYERRVNASVKEAVAKGDFYKVDAKGKTPQELSADGDIDSWLNIQVEKAKKLGKDGLIIENIDDAVGLYDKPSTHYAIFDAKNIKTKSQLTDIWKKANLTSAETLKFNEIPPEQKAKIRKASKLEEEMQKYAIKPVISTVNIPKGNIIESFISTVQDNIPFFESSAGKKLKTTALNQYKFNDNTKKNLMDKAEITYSLDIKSPAAGEEVPSRVIDYIPGAIPLMEKISETGVPIPEFLDRILLRQAGNRKMINISQNDIATTAHELFHAAVEDGLDYKAFNKDWEKIPNPIKKAIDNNLKNPIYEGIDEESIANERFAYLGELRGVGGLKSIPSEMRKFYKEILK